MNFLAGLTNTKTDPDAGILNLMSDTKRHYKLFKVLSASGRFTTVSIDPILFLRACQLLGGVKAVRKLVHEAVAEYETASALSMPRSRYVSQALLEKISAV